MTNLLFEGYIILGIIDLSIGWTFYYLSWPYWRRKDFWEKYTWMGVIAMSNKIKYMSEPGRTYSKISQFMLIHIIIIWWAILILIALLNMI